MRVVRGLHSRVGPLAAVLALADAVEVQILVNLLYHNWVFKLILQVVLVLEILVEVQLQAVPAALRIVE